MVFRIYEEKVEAAIRERLHFHHAARQAAERRDADGEAEALEEEDAVAHLNFVLDDYRRLHGFRGRSGAVSPALAREYGHLGPAELVEYWASKHGGWVVVKELAAVAMDAGGAFRDDRSAYAQPVCGSEAKGFREGPTRLLCPE